MKEAATLSLRLISPYQSIAKFVVRRKKAHRKVCFFVFWSASRSEAFSENCAFVYPLYAY